ncbi:MAG: hypothetical protein FJ410_06315 [Verrucomicrobia bacterium]|nr:hypothetical protein [Verrucomicrobiota bacterium]
MRHAALLLLTILTGCLMPGSRSETVVFHAFSSPSGLADRTQPTLYLPRAGVPAGLRRPTLVIERLGSVLVQDSHRWLAPLESAVPEAVGRRLTALTGLPCASQPPAEDHFVLHADLLRMDVVDGLARLRLRFRLETSAGERRHESEAEWSSPLATDEPGEFVAAQSSNLDKAAASLVSLLPKR